jgi:hypothetical protein
MHSADIEWFERVQRPVICMLAIAPYPLTADEICGWITDSHQFDRVKIREVQWVLAEWRQFLVAEDTNPSTWRLYHRSFADFLASDEADGVDLDEYRRASVAATKSKIDRSG